MCSSRTCLDLLSTLGLDDFIFALLQGPLSFFGFDLPLTFELTPISLQSACLRCHSEPSEGSIHHLAIFMGYLTLSYSIL